MAIAFDDSGDLFIEADKDGKPGKMVGDHVRVARARLPGAAATEICCGESRPTAV